MPRGRRHQWQQRGCSRRIVQFLYPSLLLLLHRSPAHGYTLLEQLAEFGFEDLNPGLVYRALREMEADGLVESSWDKEQSQGPPRRIYRIIAQGDEVLAWWTEDLQETRSLIDDLLVAYRRHMQEGRGDYH